MKSRLHRIDNHMDMRALGQLRNDPNFKVFLNLLVETKKDIDKMWRERIVIEDIWQDQGAANIVDEILTLLNEAMKTARIMENSLKSPKIF